MVLGERFTDPRRHPYFVEGSADDFGVSPAATDPAKVLTTTGIVNVPTVLTPHLRSMARHRAGSQGPYRRTHNGRPFGPIET
jgi:hypothetical protein